MLQQHLTSVLGRDIKITAFPWGVLTLLSPFWELAREMREMRYLYAMPHQISAAKFEHLLPEFEPTDLHSVMQARLPRDIYPNQMVGSGGAPVLS